VYQLILFFKKAINKHINQIYKPIALDTFVIYRWLIQKGLLPEKFIQNNSLKSVALSLGVEPKELHDALADAFITAQIFQRLISFLSELNIYTVQEMLNIGSPDISGYMGIAKKKYINFKEGITMKEEILNSKEFKNLVKSKNCISLILTVLELIVYFGFILLIAYNREFLNQKFMVL